jgi:hypothetical protein
LAPASAGAFSFWHQTGFFKWLRCTLPEHSSAGNAAIILHTTINRTAVAIELANVSEEAYHAIAAELDGQLSLPNVKNRDAICEAFLLALMRCPGANPSDLWHQVVYRLYCEILQKHRPQDPGQSWKRASGDALELAVQQIYTPVLRPHNIGITALVGRDSKRQALEHMGLLGQVGDSKLDVLITRTDKLGADSIVGGVHIKASLAERVSDDIPCSRAMQARELFSPLFTLDVKSFPPPGDVVNRGELGSPAMPSEKRKYIENHGDFDNCYSGNFRTQPSAENTPSGKRIYVVDLASQPDAMAQEIIARVQKAKDAAC